MLSLSWSRPPTTRQTMRLQRQLRLQTRRVPALRALGFAVVLAAVYLQGGPTNRVLALTASIVTYCLVAWVVMDLYYRTERSAADLDVGWLFHLADLVVCAIVVQATGGGQSWLFFLLLVPVWNQTHFSARRSLVSGALASVLYLLILLVTPWLEHEPVSVPMAAQRALIILLVTAYCAVSARSAEQATEQMIAAIRSSRRNAEQRAAHLSSLNRLTQTVSSAGDLQHVLDCIAKEMLALFDVTHCAITMRDDDHECLRVLAFSSTSADAPDIRGYEIPYRANPSCNEAIESRKPVVVSDAQTSPMTIAVHDAMRQLGVHNLMVVPLVFEAEVSGTISLQARDESRVFTEEDKTLAETAAGHVAGTIRKVQKYEEERRSRQLAERLQAAAQTMSSSLALTDVLGSILDHLHVVVTFDAASIQLIEGEAMRVIAVRGHPPSDVGRMRSFAEHPYNHRLATARAPIVLDLAVEQQWREHFEKGFRTVMGIPLTFQDRIIGAMSIDSVRARAYSGRDAEAAMSFARFAAVAVEHARLYEAVQQLSMLDPLTGVANRRRFDEVLSAEWRRATRDGTPFSLLMIDVDDFKAYNDHYGHPAGDLALKCVASTLGEGLQRAGDVLARYGGEEFVVLLPSTSAAAAAQHAERLRRRVEILGLEHARARAGRVVTVSLGVATMIVGEDDDPSALLIAADEQLYDAKELGRNRVAATEVQSRSALAGV